MQPPPQPDPSSSMPNEPSRNDHQTRYSQSTSTDRRVSAKTPCQSHCPFSSRQKRYSRPFGIGTRTCNLDWYNNTTPYCI
jgi:hypothetical protein